MGPSGGRDDILATTGRVYDRDRRQASALDTLFTDENWFIGLSIAHAPFCVTVDIETRLLSASTWDFGSQS